jgi:hypothetical protein
MIDQPIVLEVRANRAQYAEISLRSFNEGDIANVALPLVQGLPEDESEYPDADVAISWA